MTAAVTLAYAAAMQEAGVPVTYAYISDAHHSHAGGGAFGPGEAGYVAQLAAYDAAFAAFFDRLARDGIDRTNTLFVFTADEGDHFVGGAPSPAGCDGVHVPCTYGQIGEIDANLTGLLAQAGVTTPMQIAQSQGIYVDGNPGPTDPTTRALERVSGALTIVSPITGGTEPVADDLADPTEMGLLHMRTGDPARTPTFTLFVHPDQYLYTGGSTCSPSSPCVQEKAAYAWNHGMVSPDVDRTWLGMVGPGVAAEGVTGDVWSDHADVRPTMMALLGLADDHTHQGRVLVEALRRRAWPDGVRDDRGTFEVLARAYKRINAPVGPFALATLRIATHAARSGTSSDDGEFTRVESSLAQLGQQRDALVAAMERALEADALTAVAQSAASSF